MRGIFWASYLLVILIFWGFVGTTIARATGLTAPELEPALNESPVGLEINDRVYSVLPDSLITFQGVSVAGWGGCWDCPVNDKPLTDLPSSQIPLPGTIWVAATAIWMLVLVKRWSS